MNRLLAFCFLLISLCANASVQVNFALTNYDATVSTNSIILTPVSERTFYGDWLQVGPIIRIPTTNGLCSRQLTPGDYKFEVQNQIWRTNIIFAVPSSGGPYTLQQLWVSGGNVFNYGGQLATLTGVGTLVDWSQLATNILGTLGGGGSNPAYTGDVTKALNGTVTTLVNIPSATPMAGSLKATAIASPSTPAAGFGSIYVDSTSKNIAVKDDAGTIKHGAQTINSVAHNWLIGMNDAGLFTASQPDFSDLTGSAAAGQMPALTGDVTSTAGTVATTLANMPSGVVMAGRLFATAIVSPATPSAGHGSIYVDSTSKNIAVKDDAGIVKHGVQTKNIAANLFFSALNDAGSITATQPTFANISGQIAASQFGALTGDVTSSSGSSTTTLANIPAAVPMAGTILATAIVAPATPSAGTASIYVDSTSKNLSVIDDAGVVKHGAQTKNSVSHSWLISMNDAGLFSSSQPAFTDISGSLGSAQFGPLTGDVTSSGYAATLANIPTATTMAGRLLATAIAQPATPAAGKASIYIDSTSKNLAAINDVGTVVHGVQTINSVGSQWLISLNDAGSFARSQPGFSDLSGTISSAQNNKWTLTAPTTSATLTAGADNLTYTGPSTSQTLVGVTSTDTLQNKTIDAANNVLKFKSYIYLTGFHNCTGAIPQNTNDYTASTFMKPVFLNAIATNANFIEFQIQVPDDFDTAVDPRIRITDKLTAADTGVRRYVVTMNSVANSAAYAGTVATGINVDIAADASGASGDVEQSSLVTLTGWGAAVTAGRHWVIRIARDGNSATDTSTVDSMFSLAAIEYGATQ